MTIQIIAILFFVALFLGALAFYAGYTAVRSSPQYELRKRLKTLALEGDEEVPRDLTAELMREAKPLDKFLFKFFLIRKLDVLIDNAGLKIDVKAFILFMLAFALSGFIVGLTLKRGILPALILLLVGIIAPLIFLRIKKDRRYNRFTEQFPDALDMIARSLRAGHAFSGAIQLIGNEMSDPVAGLFKTVYEEQTLGLPMSDALSHMLESMPSIDLRLFVTAVNVHREVGGNLADTLERLGTTIRERIKIRRQVRVYTAQGRVSGYILAALPIAMAIFLYFLMPDYIKELWLSKTGRYVIAAAVSLQIIGFFVIKRLINIRI